MRGKIYLIYPAPALPEEEGIENVRCGLIMQFFNFFAFSHKLNFIAVY